MNSKINLQKYIASSGICSRRQAEKLIKEEKVKINGKIAKITDRVNKNDTVKVNNKIIQPTKNNIYIMLNKPFGYTCTTKKFRREKNILELINLREKIFPVGRLDKESSGLLLLTNDGDLALKLTHPRYKHEKEYEVILNNEISNEKIKKLKTGVLIEDDTRKILAKAKKVKKLNDKKISLTITEGKKRQIRKMIKAIGLNVVKLKRIRISGLFLGDLRVGRWKNLTKEEIAKLTLN